MESGSQHRLATSPGRHLSPPLGQHGRISYITVPEFHRLHIVRTHCTPL